MSGNYQSRVFTFISKRTNRLKDTCAQGLRHIKVAVVWGGQILLYPIHLLTQTTKIFQPQLASPPQPQSLPQPAPDLNIEQVLELVIGSGYPITITEQPGSLVVEDAYTRNLPPQVFTGKRSTMVDRDSRQIESYDLDTEDWEVSSYSPRSFRQVMARKPVIRGLSSLLIDRQLVLVTTTNEILDILTISQQQEIRRRIGIDLATTWDRWHQRKITEQSSPQISAANRELLILNQTTTSGLAIAGKEGNTHSPNLLERWNNWLQSFNAKTPDSLPVNGPIINQKSLLQFPATKYSFTPQPPTIDRLWNLPQLPPIIEDRSITTATNRVEETISKLQPEWFKQLWHYYRDYLYIPSKVDGEIIHQPAEFQLIPLVEPSSQNADGKPESIGSQQSLVTANSGNISVKLIRELESDRDWIDAASEEIGYSKSPLTRFFAWLDRVILQIENWLIKIWQTIADRAARN